MLPGISFCGGNMKSSLISGTQFCLGADIHVLSMCCLVSRLGINFRMILVKLKGGI